MPNGTMHNVEDKEMKQSKLYIMCTSGLILIVAIMWFFIGVDQKESSAVFLQDTTAAGSLASGDKAEPSIATPQPVSNNTAEGITGLSDTALDLETSWNVELGCYNLPEDHEMRCEYAELTASSHEEAMWMFENGYPTATVLREMEALSDEELMELSKSRENWLPLLILGQRYAENGDLSKANSSFSRSEFRNPNSFGMLRSGMSLIENSDPNSPGWSYVEAAVQFKKAALLGDYVGKQLLNELYYSYWNGNPGVFLTTSIIEAAHRSLGSHFELPWHQWQPAQQRPGG